MDRGVLVEVKAIDAIRPVHKAQLLTYLRVADMRAGLLSNFNRPRLVEGVSRVLNPEVTT